MLFNLPYAKLLKQFGIVQNNSDYYTTTINCHAVPSIFRTILLRLG